MKKIDKDELHTIFCKMETEKELYFNKLYENYKGLIFAIAFSVVKNKEDSEDIVQKIYIKIWNIENQKMPKSNEASWLYSITKNEAIDFIRSKKTLLNVDELYFISEEDKELNEVIDREHYNNIISRLNLQEQEIISLKILSNLSFKEISQILNISENTVKWKYYKSIHTLKLLLGNLGMFIITFTISLKTAFSSKKKSSQISNEIQEEISVPDTSTTSSQQQTAEDNYTEHTINNTIQENTTQQLENSTIQDFTEQSAMSTNNYFEIGIWGISAFFLIFTIIFSIILTKHQLNKKYKSSK